MNENSGTPAENTSTIRVLIIANHPGVRADMRVILQLADEIDVVGEAASQDEAVRQCQVLHPDVALVDLEMNGPGGDGYATITKIHTLRLAQGVAALTSHDYPAARDKAIHCGANAIIIKGADFNNMLETIQTCTRERKCQTQP